MVQKQTKTRISNTWPWLVGILLLVAILIVGKLKYNDVFHSNINLSPNQSTYLFIPTGSDYSALFEILVKEELLIDTASFGWVAEQKNLKAHVNPGRYLIGASMSNNELIDKIRSGKQSPVRVSFTKARTKEDLSGKIGRYLEADSLSLLRAIRNDSLIASYGFDKNTILSVFIPNSYDFYWNTSAELFLKRMVVEHKKFWNSSREKKAGKIGMSKIEVSTLASIVEEETIMENEKATMAGVYINRIRRNIPLQADPTIKFALGNFELRRIRTRDLKIDSPFNTYINTGLPPGPICIPSISSIDAVLNYEDHSYLFFCAKDDFSGYHAFSKTLREHNLAARKYHRALNSKRIYK